MKKKSVTISKGPRAPSLSTAARLKSLEIANETILGLLAAQAETARRKAEGLFDEARAKATKDVSAFDTTPPAPLAPHSSRYKERLDDVLDKLFLHLDNLKRHSEYIFNDGVPQTAGTAEVAKPYSIEAKLSLIAEVLEACVEKQLDIASHF